MRGNRPHLEEQNIFELVKMPGFTGLSRSPQVTSMAKQLGPMMSMAVSEDFQSSHP